MNQFLSMKTLQLNVILFYEFVFILTYLNKLACHSCQRCLFENTLFLLKNNHRKLLYRRKALNEAIRTLYGYCERLLLLYEHKVTLEIFSQSPMKSYPQFIGQFVNYLGRQLDSQTQIISQSVVSGQQLVFSSTESIVSSCRFCSRHY